MRIFWVTSVLLMSFALTGCTPNEQLTQKSNFQIDTTNELCVQFGPNYSFSQENQAQSSNCTENEAIINELYAIAENIEYEMGTKEQFEHYLPKWANEDGTASDEILIFWQQRNDVETTNFVAIYDDGRFNFQSEDNKFDLLSIKTYPDKFEQLSKMLGEYE